MIDFIALLLGRKLRIEILHLNVILDKKQIAFIIALPLRNVTTYT